MGSDEGHFNVLLIVRDKVTRQCPRTTTFEDKGEPKLIRTAVPLLTSLTPYRWAKPVHSGTPVWTNTYIYDTELLTGISMRCTDHCSARANVCGFIGVCVCVVSVSYVRVRARACVRACVYVRERACVRACARQCRARACVCACQYVRVSVSACQCIIGNCECLVCS